MSGKSRRLADWVQDIRDAIANIRSDIGALSEDAFLGDGKTLRAVAKSVSDIGEAANRVMVIAPELRQSNQIAWEHLRRVHAMRNVLAHGYFRTDAGVVWDTATVHLPKLELLLDGISAIHDDGVNEARGGAGDGP
jgi:uncharacterized protein with HEPN domain